MKPTWANNKPEEYSVQKQRRVQVKKYLELNYGAKGKEVKSWIQSHTPDPWPEASIRGLNQLIMRLTTKLDNGKPEGYSLLKWRRKQFKEILMRRGKQ